MLWTLSEGADTLKDVKDAPPQRTEEARPESPSRFRAWAPSLLLVVIGFAVTWSFVDPPPPKKLVLATGSETGAYHRYGELYAEKLKERGVEVEVRSTAGSIENLALLRSGDVDIAFVQGGTAGEEDEAVLRSLGSLYYEPLWIFGRGVSFANHQRWAIGGAGSGTRALASRFLQQYGFDDMTLSPESGAAAAAALRDGKVDAACFVSAASATYVAELLADPGVKLFPVARNRAFERRLPELAAVTLYAGMVDIKQDLPSEDVPMIAATANLAAHEDLHHALVPLLLEVAREVHGQGGPFEKRGQFPSREAVALPINDHAAQWYRSGPSFLYRVLPFRVASVLDRLKILLFPLLTLLLPLLKVTPPLYRWRIRRRVYRWYSDVRAIEGESLADGADRSALLERLVAVENETHAVKVPLSYMQELYNLRLHIELVRIRLVQ